MQWLVFYVIKNENLVKIILHVTQIQLLSLFFDDLIPKI